MTRRNWTAIDSLVIAASAGFYAAFIARSGFTIAGRSYYVLIDDSMISMTYARNLAHGRGLVWQSGPHVEGYTNFLWTIWMSALHLLPFPERLAGLPVMVSGAAILIATMLAVRGICRHLAPDSAFAPVAAMMLVGLCYPLVFWTLRGMEAGLCALLLALAVLIALRLRAEPSNRRLLLLGTLLAAAVLTRDDMLVPAAVVVAFVAYSAGREGWRRAAAIAGGLVVLAIAAHIAFRLAYYGDALPNTYYLKLGDVPLGTRLHRGVVGVAWTTAIGLYLPIACGVVALLCARRTARLAPLAFVGAVFASECLYSVYVGGDFAEQLQFANRFIVTVLPLLMVLAVIGIDEIVRRAGTATARRAGLALAAAAAVVAMVAQYHGWGATSILRIAGPGPYRAVRVVIAVLAAVLLAAMAFDLATPRRLGLLLPLALLLLTLATFDYAPMRRWASSGAIDTPFERFETGRALIFRRSSARSNSAALIAAGNWAYFSHRPGVDLLGKMDPVIAHGPSRPIVFRPGHTKWDYGYSIGRLRPDVITGLSSPTERDLCNISAWGYRQIASHFFVRSGARGIDVPRLAAELAAFDRRPHVPMPMRCNAAP